MYGPLHTFVLFWRWECMDRHILYLTTYTREQYDNFNLGYSQSAIHVVVLKHVGLIRVWTRIPANVQETELCCNTPQNTGQGSVHNRECSSFRLCWIKGSFAQEQAASAGLHLCFFLWQTLQWLLEAEWIYLHAFQTFLAGSSHLVLADLLSEESLLCYLPPCLHHLSNHKPSPFT